MQESAEYFVESDGVRSEVFKLEVVDLPFVKQLDLVLSFPAYTRLPAKTIEDGGDVAALKGTVVTVTARLSGKARAARIVFADGRKVEMKAAGDGLRRRADGDGRHELLHRADERGRRDLPRLERVRRDGARRPAADRHASSGPGATRRRPTSKRSSRRRAPRTTSASPRIEMYFSVNGGEEQKVNLQELEPRRGARA